MILVLIWTFGICTQHAARAACRGVAHGEVSAADAALKEQVAAENEGLFLDVEANVPRAVPWGVHHFGRER